MEHQRRFPEFYITAPQPCPYVNGRFERKMFTHLTKDRPRALIDNLLRAGFRRSQNIAYIPYCDHCTACVPIRISVQDFEPRRTLRKIWRLNQTIETQRVHAVPTLEQYSLFRSYVEARHADGGMADMSFGDYSTMIKDSAIETFLTEYRMPTLDQLGNVDNPLVATVLCDLLTDGLSLVYSFYEPELSWRSLGSYLILEQIEFARNQGLPYVYLGYWIEGSRKMSYKARFQPQEHLTSSGWTQAKPIVSKI